MFELKEKDKDFLVKNIPDIEETIKKGNKREIQDALYLWMEMNCFDEESDGSYNALGREAVKIWDSIKETE